MHLVFEKWACARGAHPKSQQMLQQHVILRRNGPPFCHQKNVPCFFPMEKQGLVNVPIVGDFEHHRNKYLLEIISPIVGWCETLGHLPTPEKPMVKAPHGISWWKCPVSSSWWRDQFHDLWSNDPWSTDSSLHYHPFNQPLLISINHDYLTIKSTLFPFR